MSPSGAISPARAPVVLTSARRVARGLRRPRSAAAPATIAVENAWYASGHAALQPAAADERLRDRDEVALPPCAKRPERGVVRQVLPHPGVRSGVDELVEDAAVRVVAAQRRVDRAEAAPHDARVVVPDP